MYKTSLLLVLLVVVVFLPAADGATSQERPRYVPCVTSSDCVEPELTWFCDVNFDKCMPCAEFCIGTWDTLAQCKELCPARYYSLFGRDQLLQDPEEKAARDQPPGGETQNEGETNHVLTGVMVVGVLVVIVLVLGLFALYRRRPERKQGKKGYKKTPTGTERDPENPDGKDPDQPDPESQPMNPETTATVPKQPQPEDPVTMATPDVDTVVEEEEEPKIRASVEVRPSPWMGRNPEQPDPGKELGNVFAPSGATYRTPDDVMGDVDDVTHFRDMTSSPLGFDPDKITHATLGKSAFEMQAPRHVQQNDDPLNLDSKTPKAGFEPRTPDSSTKASVHDPPAPPQMLQSMGATSISTGGATSI